MTESTRISIDGALFSGECKLLLLRRLDGIWELPNGPLEFGEEPEYGVARVFAELTCIEVTPDRPLGAWSLLENCGAGFQPASSGVAVQPAQPDSRIHAVHIGYTVTLAGTLLGVELDPEKHSAFAWLNQNELADRIQSPPMQRACERAFNALARPRKSK